MRLLVLSSLFLSCIFTAQVFAHPGGVDSNNCHTCLTNCEEKYNIPTGEYHCHENGNTDEYTPAPQTEPSLTDIEENQYKTAIEYLLQKKIVSGYPDGTYQPNRALNRAELVKIIVGAVLNGQDPPTLERSCFPDVPLKEWYASYVCYAKTQGIVDGYPDNTFRPTNQINLVELAKILVHALNVTVDTGIQTGIWYEPFIHALQANKSLPDSFLKLDQQVNRAQMAEMTWRILENITDQPSTTLIQSQSNSNTQQTTSPDDNPIAGNPQGMCVIPEEAQQEDISNPTTVIGNGTAESCTSQAVVQAVAQGGIITFNCGPDPLTIKMEETAKIHNDSTEEIVIDGGGKITLDGQGERRILYMNTCDKALTWTTSHCNDQDHPRVSIQNLTFQNGNSTGLKDPDGGGAIFARGGKLKVINSRFFNNQCDTVGPDVGGAAIRAFDQYNDEPLYIVNSTFGGAEGLGNRCSNGGGISSIGVSYSVFNSVFTHNTAIGKGANPAKSGTPGGGNGGAIYNDGNTFTLNLCGTEIHNNTANEGGGGIFFVSNNRTGHLNIKDSNLSNNPSLEFETKGFPGIFYLGNGDIQVENSNIE